MNSAVIYVRSSTNKRTDIDRQIEECMELSQKNDLIVSETYTDIDSSYVERERLIQDCKARKIRSVIVYCMNRLSRNIEDLQILMKTFEDNAVKIFLCREDSSLMSSFQLGILKAMGYFALG